MTLARVAVESVVAGRCGQGQIRAFLTAVVDPGNLIHDHLSFRAETKIDFQISAEHPWRSTQEKEYVDTTTGHNAGDGSQLLLRRQAQCLQQCDRPHTLCLAFQIAHATSSNNMDRRRGSPPPPPRGRGAPGGGLMRDPRGGDPFANDRDERETGGSFNNRRRRSPSPAYDRFRGGPPDRRGSPPPPPKRGRRDEPYDR